MRSILRHDKVRMDVVSMLPMDGMDESLEIRRGSREEAEGIARVHVAATRAAYRDVYTPTYLNNISVEQWTQRWAADKSHLVIGEPFGVFVATQRGSIIGFADTGPDGDGREAELYAIYVDPLRVRAGVGVRLFRACVDHAKARGFRAMHTTVLSKNTRGRAFYARMGGIPVPESEMFVLGGGVTDAVISYRWPSL